MIFGSHVLLYSADADADRAFFRDVLGLKTIDAGQGWLIFALPPAELGVHPIEDEEEHGHTHEHAEQELLDTSFYLMCDDVRATIASLKSKKVACSEPIDAGYGITTTIRLPSGGRIGLYEPRHPMAIERK